MTINTARSQQRDAIRVHEAWRDGDTRVVLKTASPSANAEALEREYEILRSLTCDGIQSPSAQQHR